MEIGIGKREYDSNGYVTYWESSNGDIIDRRPKSTCEGKIVEVDGKKYQLKEVK
jgi:ribosome-associated protein YbcJ (S4-like RNA binding protein)